MICPLISKFPFSAGTPVPGWPLPIERVYLPFATMMSPSQSPCLGRASSTGTPLLPRSGIQVHSLKSAECAPRRTGHVGNCRYARHVNGQVYSLRSAPEVEVMFSARTKVCRMVFLNQVLVRKVSPWRMFTAKRKNVEGTKSVRSFLRLNFTSNTYQTIPHFSGWHQSGFRVSRSRGLLSDSSEHLLSCHQPSILRLPALPLLWERVYGCHPARPATALWRCADI